MRERECTCEREREREKESERETETETERDRERDRERVSEGERAELCRDQQIRRLTSWNGNSGRLTNCTPSQCWFQTVSG